ncbi:hypothetical protein QC820_09975 [Halomonas mongoliensis]|uniref:Uncharacterized protein n=1 Tax=Halomonas mongoliensis TaxID=321265 RepID=A0ABU1GM85_9GAMM|nr:hypothetical protein [Halomonas mongoliensis]MDR5893144.1 hypothetical protein [Halomonas mongoliensis]
MTQATYRHYPSFTRRYVRSVMKMMGLPKKPSIEEEIFGQMVLDERVVHSINGEVLMLEWHHGREGRVVVPEPTLSSWLQTVQLSKVQGDAWSCPWEFSTLSFPTSQIFHGHPVDGALVACGTCQPDSDSLLKINVDFVAVSLAAGRVGKFTTL